jgi:hypothetical protein
VCFKTLSKEWTIKNWLGDGHFCSAYEGVATDGEAKLSDMVFKLFRTGLEGTAKSLMETSYKRELAAMKAIKAASKATDSIKVLDYFLTLHAFEVNGWLVFSPICQPFGEGKCVLESGHVRQLLLALKFLHEKCKLAHWDIAPKHLLLNPTTNGLTLIDLGSASKLGELASVQGTMMTMAASKLEVLLTPGSGCLAPTASHDLESVIKSIQLMKDPFLCKLMEQAGATLSGVQAGRLLQRLWEQHLLPDALELCQSCDYLGLLKLLTDSYVCKELRVESQEMALSADRPKGKRRVSSRDGDGAAKMSKVGSDGEDDEDDEEEVGSL